MSYKERLVEEINAVLDKLTEREDSWRASWIAHEVCQAHKGGLVDGPESDFWLHCGYTDCRREVTRCINRRAGTDSGQKDPQLRLPGYDHLQMYYVVERDGEEVGYPIHDCTDQELEAKRVQYRTMGFACFAHADEIERYPKSRRNVG